MTAHPALVECRGHGPDLVLIHGWAMHSGIWGRALDLLEAHFRLHLVDLPGHGRNRHQAWPHDWQGWNDELGAALPEGAMWMGWSLGGLFVLDQALRFPQRLKGVVLVASNACFIQRPHWPHGMAEAVFDEFANALSRDYRSTLERFLALEVHGAEHAQRALRELRDCAFAHGSPSLDALEGGLEMLHNCDFSTQLTQLQPALLALGGRRDRLVPPGALSTTAERVRDGRAVIIPGAGHAPFIGHRDEFARQLVEFQQHLSHAPSAVQD